MERTGNGVLMLEGTEKQEKQACSDATNEVIEASKRKMLKRVGVFEPIMLPFCPEPTDRRQPFFSTPSVLFKMRSNTHDLTKTQMSP